MEVWGEGAGESAAGALDSEEPGEWLDMGGKAQKGDSRVRGCVAGRMWRKAV